MIKTYEEELHDHVLGFWLANSLDWDDLGYIACLDREGRSYSTDKSVLLIARTVLLYSRLFNKVRRDPVWLDAATLGYAFLLRHLARTADQPYLLVTKSGVPLERFFFSVEAYVVAGLAEYAVAAGSEEAVDVSRRMLLRLSKLYQCGSEGSTSPDSVSRRTVSLLPSLLYLGTCQILRALDEEAVDASIVDGVIDYMLQGFLDSSAGVLREKAPANGGLLPGPEGRMAIPGHSIHVSGLLLQEAARRSEMLEQGARLLESSLELGWDAQYGGLLNVVDLGGRPSLSLDWDMKLWWVHSEAMYATLLAHHLTDDPRFEAWHNRISEYTFNNYPDHEFGGWFGYLHRDGTLVTSAKGSFWKSVYHEAMGLWQCIDLLSRSPADMNT